MLGGPLEHRARRRVAGDRAVAQDDDAVGVRQAALEPVLGEDDGGPLFLVEAAQQPDQLVAGDGVELRGRLVEQDERRAAGERRAERDALQLAAGELVRGAVEQVGDAERERGLLDAARDRRGRQPAVLQAEGELRAHGPHDDLRLGVLQQRARDDRQVARPVLARVEAADDDAPGDLAAVEVRHEAAGRAHERRLPGRRQAGEHDELARLDAPATRRAARASRRPGTCT